jgi:hypothetical protein
MEHHELMVDGQRRTSVSNSPSQSMAMPAPWVQVLEKVEQTLVRAEADAAEREAEAAESDPGILEERTQSWRPSQQRINERTQRWQEGLKQVEQCISEVDSVLSAGELALQNWLEEGSAVGQRLAIWAARGV